MVRLPISLRVEIAQGRVPPAPVARAFDAGEQVRPCLGTHAVEMMVNQLGSHRRVSLGVVGRRFVSL